MHNLPGACAENDFFDTKQKIHDVDVFLSHYRSRFAALRGELSEQFAAFALNAGF